MSEPREHPPCVKCGARARATYHGDAFCDEHDPMFRPIPAVPADAGSGETEPPAFTLAHARAMREALYSAETLSRQYRLLAARLRTVEAERDRLRPVLTEALNLLSTFRDHVAFPELLANDEEEIEAFLARASVLTPPSTGEPS